MLRFVLCLLMLAFLVVPEVGCAHDFGQQPSDASVSSCSHSSQASDSDTNQTHPCHLNCLHFSIEPQAMKFDSSTSETLKLSRYAFLYSNPHLDAEVRPPLAD